MLLRRFCFTLFLLISTSALYAQTGYKHVSGDIKFMNAAPSFYGAQLIKRKVKKAIRVYKAGGLDAVKAAFPDNDQREDYIAMVGADGVFVFGNAKAGETFHAKRKDILKTDIVDPSLAKLIDVVKNKPGWVRFNWIDPLNGKVAPKVDYFEYHDGYLFSAGHYLQGQL